MTLMRDKLWRSRWGAIGAAVAVGVGERGVVRYAVAAGGASSPSSFVAITPCRLFDTRAGAGIGPRSTALNPLRSVRSGRAYGVDDRAGSARLTAPTPT
jgi:hypothetical protein